MAPVRRVMRRVPKARNIVKTSHGRTEAIVKNQAIHLWVGRMVQLLSKVAKNVHGTIQKMLPLRPYGNRVTTRLGRVRVIVHTPIVQMVRAHVKVALCNVQPNIPNTQMVRSMLANLKIRAIFVTEHALLRIWVKNRPKKFRGMYTKVAQWTAMPLAVKKAII